MHGILFFRLDKSSLSIGFHKRLKITRGRNKRWDQRPRLRTKIRDQSLQASKWYLKCKCRPKNWITCSLYSLLKMLIKILYDFLIFLLTTSTYTGPCHAFYTRTSFRGIEDVEYIPKFWLQKTFKSHFFILLFLKIPKGINI